MRRQGGSGIGNQGGGGARLRQLGMSKVTRYNGYTNKVFDYETFYLDNSQSIEYYLIIFLLIPYQVRVIRFTVGKWIQ